MCLYIIGKHWGSFLSHCTWPFHQASLTILVSRWMESVVVCPGLAQKWLAGSICNFLHMVTMSRA